MDTDDVVFPRPSCEDFVQHHLRYVRTVHAEHNLSFVGNVMFTSNELCSSCRLACPGFGLTIIYVFWQSSIKLPSIGCAADTERCSISMLWTYF